MTSVLAASVVAGARWSERLPGPTYESPTEGSPGFAGFVATFLLALAVIALGASFTRRMRRASHRDRLRADAAARAGEGTAGVPGDAPAGAPGTAATAATGTGTGTTDDTGGTDDTAQDPPAAGPVPGDAPR